MNLCFKIFRKTTFWTPVGYLIRKNPFSAERQESCPPVKTFILVPKLPIRKLQIPCLYTIDPPVWSCGYFQNYDLLKAYSMFMNAKIWGLWIGHESVNRFLKFNKPINANMIIGMNAMNPSMWYEILQKTMDHFINQR